MAKPRKQKLKVFKTPIGFHDAYVAASSRKAALEIWGAGTDLFQAGIAEEVKEHTGESAKEALAKPGEVVRAKRTGAEVIPFERKPAAKKDKEAGRRTKSEMSKPAQPKPKPKPKPRPSRVAFDKAQAELAKLEEKQEAELAELAKEEEKLAKRRRALEDKQRKATEKAEAKRDAAERAYRKAMAQWLDEFEGS